MKKSKKTKADLGVPRVPLRALMGNSGSGYHTPKSTGKRIVERERGILKIDYMNTDIVYEYSDGSDENVRNPHYESPKVRRTGNYIQSMVIRLVESVDAIHGEEVKDGVVFHYDANDNLVEIEVYLMNLIMKPDMLKEFDRLVPDEFRVKFDDNGDEIQ